MVPESCHCQVSPTVGRHQRSAVGGALVAGALVAGALVAGALVTGGGVLVRVLRGTEVGAEVRVRGGGVIVTGDGVRAPVAVVTGCEVGVTAGLLLEVVDDAGLFDGVPPDRDARVSSEAEDVPGTPTTVPPVTGAWSAGVLAGPGELGPAIGVDPVVATALSPPLPALVQAASTMLSAAAQTSRTAAEPVTEPLRFSTDRTACPSRICSPRRP